ncbi:MAG: hypothetical protein ACK6BG_06265 [Cyanobacteriota bacterium]
MIGAQAVKAVDAIGVLLGERRERLAFNPRRGCRRQSLTYR